MSGAQHARIWTLILVLWLAAVGPAAAVMTNPDPINFGADDGSQLFLPSLQLLTTETFDFFASEFGFFYANDPGTLIPIFKTDDQSVFPPPQRASIDFALGQVFDLDQGGVLQNSFIPGSGGVGFYVTSALATWFSVAAMNPQGDLFGSFPQIGNPTGYLLVFVTPNLSIPVTTHFADGIQAMPIVGTPVLLLTGLAAGAAFHRRSRKRD